MRFVRWRRSFFWKYLKCVPRPKHLHGTWLHRKLGDSLLLPALWQPERKKVAAGFALGAFFSMFPMPLQTIAAVFFGYILRVNLASAMVAVWISNPVTTPAILFIQFKIGQAILGPTPLSEQDPAQTFDLIAILKEAPAAILCGAGVTGFLLSAISYPLALWLWDAVSAKIKKH